MVFKNSLSTALPCSKTVSGQYPILLKPQYKNKLEGCLMARAILLS